MALTNTFCKIIIMRLIIKQKPLTLIVTQIKNSSGNRNYTYWKRQNHNDWWLKELVQLWLVLMEESLNLVQKKKYKKKEVKKFYLHKVVSVSDYFSSMYQHVVHALRSLITFLNSFGICRNSSLFNKFLGFFKGTLQFSL